MALNVTSDFVVFVWLAGATSSQDNGGGATKAAWDANTPSDFMNTDSGEAIVSVNAVNVTSAAGGTKLNINHAANVTVITGTIARLDFSGTYINGYFPVTVVDNNNVTIDVTYSVDITCDIDIGGAIDGLFSLIDAATDLMDASTYKCDVFVQGDETFTADLTVAAGGGTTSTMLRFLGVDSNWARIVPTRVAIGGGIANGLLDTSIMPRLTVDTGFSLLFNINFVQVDGLWVTGNDPVRLMGSAASDQQVYSNCVIDNASTTNNAISLVSDVGTLVYNCDLIASGATGNTVCCLMDAGSVVIHSRIISGSSSTSSVGIRNDVGLIVNCVFDTVQGLAIFYDANASTVEFHGAINCTFYECGTEVQVPNFESFTPLVYVNNLSVGNDTTIIDNLWTSDRLFFSAFNRIIDFDTTKYPTDLTGELGFQDILGAGTDFVNAAGKDFNLRATAPAKNAGPMLGNCGAMSDEEAAGAGTGEGWW